MYHVKYRDSFGKLILMEGRSSREDAESEAVDCARARHSEVEILVDIDTADVNMKEAVASFRRSPPVERDDGTQTEATPLR
jgi:hypothetical protein